MGLNKRLIGAGATASGALTPSENFKAVTYTGTGSAQTIEVGFQPDMIWYKSRNIDYDHNVYDSTRGLNVFIRPNSNIAQYSASDQITGVTSTGFTLGTGNDGNQNGYTFVAWCWKANGGTTTSVTGTNISSATQQVNTDIDFSITQFTEGSSGTSAVPHGLSGTPDMYIVKRTGGTQDWYVWHNGLSAGNSYVILNSTAAQGSNNNMWTQVDSTNINLGPWNTEGGGTKIVYAFKNVDSFSKFGSYTGNGSANGPIVETGFEPAFIMVKNTTSSGQDWRILDNKRNTSNPRNCYLSANNSNAEECQYDQFDFLSNGFQVITTDGSLNQNTSNFIYMAFAADPDTEAPTLADSFNIKTYTGNGSSNSITGLGFKPGLIWMKRRDTAQEHALVNIVSGPLKHLYSDLASAEQTTTNGVSSFNDDGWTMGANGLMNNTNNTYVGWAWKADDNEATIEEVTEDADAIAIYKFEDNANDVTGSYNATASNVSYVTGNFNKAAEFNGTNSYISRDASFLPFGNAARTFSFWVKLDTHTGDQFFMSYGTSTTGKFFAPRVTPANQGGYISFMGNGADLNSNVVMTTGVWMHLCYTYDGSVLKIYKNGVEIASGALTLNTTDLRDFTIGARDETGTPSKYVDGQIDQIRIYDKALTAASVTNLYNETTAQNSTLDIGTQAAVSIQSIVSANANAGMSIVKWEGDGIASSRVPHGLSAKPDMVIVKDLTEAGAWNVAHVGLASNEGIGLNSTAAAFTSMGNNGGITYANLTATTFGFATGAVGVNSVNKNGNQYIAYCFHSVSGYSKIGSYTGNGSTQSITTGFQPDFILIKKSSGTGTWRMFDSVRGTDKSLRANESAAEYDDTQDYLTFISTGFSYTNQSNSDLNENNSTYIYMAIKIN